MTPDIYWLTAVAVFTAVIWVPYVMNRVGVRGLIGATANPSPDDKPQAPWAVRMQAAHQNTVENLVVFAAVVLAGHAAGALNELTATAAMLYFWARVAYTIIYTFGVPMLRTLAFAIGSICQILIGLTVLGVI
jgi:uncharacterized MAPEG superfamily protein